MKKYAPSNEDIQKEDPRAAILIEMSNFADYNIKFNPAFLDSVKKQFYKLHYISKNQYNKLVEIYYKFEMGGC